MKIYIASSWRNKHLVMMLTSAIRAIKDNKDRSIFDVFSWIENKESLENEVGKSITLQEFVFSIAGLDKFTLDLIAIENCKIFIYLGPAGCDTWAEIGAAFGFKNAKQENKILLALKGHKEELGLMQLMIDEWFSDYTELLHYLVEYEKEYSHLY